MVASCSSNLLAVAQGGWGHWCCIQLWPQRVSGSISNVCHGNSGGAAHTLHVCLKVIQVREEKNASSIQVYFGNVSHSLRGPVPSYIKKPHGSTVCSGWDTPGQNTGFPQQSSHQPSSSGQLPAGASPHHNKAPLPTGSQAHDWHYRFPWKLYCPLLWVSLIV